MKDPATHNLDVFSKVITALARDAAADAQGIKLVDDKRAKQAVKVSFLQNEKVQVDICVSVAIGASVPKVVAALQERVKMQIEGATKFKVNSVNVKVDSVAVEQ